MGFLPRPLSASQGFGLSGKTCLRIGRLSISRCSKYNFSLVSAEFYGRILAVFVAILTCSYAHAWDEIWPQTWQSLITMLCPNGTKRIERMSVFLIMFFLKRTIPMFSPSGSLKNVSWLTWTPVGRLFHMLPCRRKYTGLQISRRGIRLYRTMVRSHHG